MVQNERALGERTNHAHVHLVFLRAGERERRAEDAADGAGAVAGGTLARGGAL